MRPLTICLLAALLFRLAFVLVGFPTLQPRWHLREDGDGYGLLAQTMRTGSYTDVSRGPVYPGFVALAGSPLAVKLVQAVLDTATVALVFWLAGFVSGGRATSVGLSAGSARPSKEGDGPAKDGARPSTVALAAAWLWAIYPLAIWRVAFVNKEVLLTFLLLGYLCVQLRALTEGKFPLWLASGALLGVINLCKPTFLLWPVVIAVFAWRQRIPVSRFAVFLLAMIVLVAPWTYRNYRVTNGAWLPVATEMGGRTTFIGNYQPTLGLWEGPGRPRWEAAVREVEAQHPGASVVELDRAFYRAAWARVAAHPVKATELAVRKCVRFWFLGAARREQAAGILVQGVYLSLALIGVWAARRSGAARTSLPIVIVLYVMALHGLSYADVRFSLLVMPVVAAFGAVGLGALAAPALSRICASGKTARPL